MVNGPDARLRRARRPDRARPRSRFADEEELRNAIERILAPLGPPGRRAQPDGRRPARRRLAGQRRDPAAGDRRPGALDPPLRRAAARAPTSWSRSGTLTAELRDAPGGAVARAAQHPDLSGGTGSGKTTLLNALSSFIEPRERVVTIEDAAELRLQQPHVVRLESRPAEVEGRGEVTIRDLLRNALRMRPDRIVIGEVRGPEALDLLTALNTGHDGALSTVHANSPADALSRLETLALMAGVGLPHEAIAEQVRRGIDLVVHLERGADGARRVTEIAEVVRAAGVRRCGAAGARERSRPVAVAARRRSPAAWRRWRRARRCSPARRSARWLRLALEPLRRAGPRGLRAVDAERRRLAALGRRSALLGGWLLSPARPLALPLAVAGPALAAWAVSQPPPPLPAPRSSARCRRSRRRSPTRSRPGARCAASLPRPRPRSTARRRSSWPGSAPSSTSAPRPPRRSRPGGGGCARSGSTPSPRRCSASASPGGDLAGAAAPLRRRRRRARPGRRGRQVGDRPGPLHRPAGGRDADRRRALRRADPARLPRQAARRAGRGALLALAAALQLAGFVAIRRLSRVGE